MESSTLIQGLLYPEYTSLDRLLNERFNEHIQLTVLNPVYIVHFFMGLSSMLMSDGVRSKYGIRRVLFTNIQDENIVRLVILTNTKRPGDAKIVKSMKVRTFDYNQKRAGWKTILTRKEYSIMKLLLNGESKDLPRDFSEKVENLYNNNRNLEKINLDEYSVEYRTYAMQWEQIHKVDQLDTQTRVKLNFVDISSNQKLKQRLSEYYIKDASALSKGPNSDIVDFTHTQDKIILFTDKKIITPVTNKNFYPNAVSNLYDQYYRATGEDSLEKLKLFFTDPKSVAEIFGKISLENGIAAQCGFTHGILFHLSYSHPSFTEVKQSIGTASYDPQTTHDPSYEMFIVHKPRFISVEQSLYHIPIVLCFPIHHTIMSQAFTLIPSSMSVNGEQGAMSLRLARKDVRTMMQESEKRPDIIDKLFDYVKECCEDIDTLASLVRIELDNVRSPDWSYPVAEKDYISRYLAGWLASSENKDSEAYTLLSKNGDPRTTKFLIRSIEKKQAMEEEKPEEEQRPQSESESESGAESAPESAPESEPESEPEPAPASEPESEPESAPESEAESDNDDNDDEESDDEMDVDEVLEEPSKHPKNIMLVVREEGMSEFHYPDALGLDEPYEQYSRNQGEDTLVINIRQEYVHSTRDFNIENRDQDFTRFVVSISYAKSSDVLNSHEIFPLPRIPLSRFDELLNRANVADERQLEHFLKASGYFVANQNRFEAFLDGIFLNRRCLKGTKADKNDHSDVFYIRSSNDGESIRKINFKRVSNQPTEETFKQLAVSAEQEMQSVSHNNGNRFFQFIFNDNQELNVRLLNKGEISSCASTRVRRNFPKSCLINYEKIKSEIGREVISAKAYESLKKISKISNYMMLGFIARDIVSDAVNERYSSLAMDVGFLLVSATSPVLGGITDLAATRLIAGGSKISGYAMGILGFGIKRAISLYIFADLVENTVAYAKNKNDTDAKLSMAVDAAFITIDILVLAAGTGTAAALSLFGGIAGVVLILGLNVYQTVKTVGRIEKILPLNTGEMIDEGLRAFFHFNIEDYVQELINEKEANLKLARDAANYLDQQYSIDTYITASAEFANNTLGIHSDTFIDMRKSYMQRVSRASPGLQNNVIPGYTMACYPRVERIEMEHKPDFWERITGFFSRIYRALRVIDAVVHGDSVHALQTAMECDNCIKKDTPLCINAFGISSTTHQDKAAFFQLGNKSDLVYGYPNKSNIFLMAGGVKSITGGSKADTLIVGSQPVTGTLDGLDGIDILDLSSFCPDELRIDGTTLQYKMGSINSSFELQGIETIILPSNENTLLKKHPEIYVGNDIQRIVSNLRMNVYIGAHPLNTDNLILELSNDTNIINYAYTGVVYYIIKKDVINGKSNFSLSISDIVSASHKVFMRENLWEIKSVTHQNRECLFQTIAGRVIRIFVSPNMLGSMEIAFHDGSVLRSKGEGVMQAVLTTSLTVPEIESAYSWVVNKLGLMMVAYSSTDNASITLSHNKFKQSGQSPASRILQNSVDHSTHIVLNGGQYLILINVNTQGRIENTTIKAENLDKVVIDLSNIIEFHSGDNASYIKVEAYMSSSPLILDVEIILDKPGNITVLGRISLENMDKFYNKLIIRNYGELKFNAGIMDPESLNTDRKPGTGSIVSYEDPRVLIPVPITLPVSADILILTPHNVEPFHEIIISSQVDQLDQYSINATTLVLTNFRYKYKNGQENLITLFIEGFYIVDKMETLRLTMGGKTVDLKKYRNAMAPDFPRFWRDLKLKTKKRG